MKDDVFTTLSASLDELNPSEGKVARYILAHTQDIIHLSISLLSQKAGVSEPTVMRFCRTMGCKGYQDFKLQLATSLASNQPQLHTTINTNDSSFRIAKKICTNTAHSLHVLQENLNSTDLEQALNCINSAKQIEIYGLGSSASVALEAQYKLCCTKKPIATHRDSHFQLLSASNLTPECLAIIICHSGESANLLEIAQLAQQQGAKVLGLTQKESSLSRYCHTILHCPEIEQSNGAFVTNTMVCQLTIIDILATALTLQNG